MDRSVDALQGFRSAGNDPSLNSSAARSAGNGRLVTKQSGLIHFLTVMGTHKATGEEGATSTNDTPGLVGWAHRRIVNAPAARAIRVVIPRSGSSLTEGIADINPRRLGKEPGSGVLDGMKSTNATFEEVARDGPVRGS